MRSGTIAGLLGCFSVQFLSVLPNLPWLPLILVTVPLLLGRWPLRVAAAGMLGFLWAGLAAHNLLESRPPPQWMKQDIVVEGRVQGLPVTRSRSLRFDLKPRSVRIDGVDGHPARGLWRLTWYGAESPPTAGESLRLKVRLRPITGIPGPGMFDYPGYLFRQRVSALGQVLSIASPSAGLADVPAAWVDRLRARTAESITASISGPAAGMVTALAVGFRGHLTRDQREILQRTGTAHLLAISGLHVGLVAGLALLAVRRLWRCSATACTLLAAPRAGALAALTAGLGYAVLAGLTLPTQRAAIMLSVAMAALVLARAVAASRLLALALLGILVIDPLAPGTAGFWLSFVAVAAILYLASTRLWPAPALYSWLRVQWLLFIAMLPVTLAVFGYLSLVAVPANLVAIPWVAVTAVPAILLGVVADLAVPGAGWLPWLLAERSLDALMYFLTWLDASAPRFWVAPLSVPLLLALCVAAVLALVPKGVPGRWLGLLLLLLVVTRPVVRDGMRIWQLDAGTANPVVIRQQDNVVVLDTGTLVGAGARVLLNHLRRLGVEEVDLLVLSRPRGDRVGGTRALRRALRVRRVEVTDPLRVPVDGARPCGGSAYWWRDGYSLRTRFIAGPPSRCIVELYRHGRRLATVDPDNGRPGAGALQFLDRVTERTAGLPASVVALDAAMPVGRNGNGWKEWRFVAGKPVLIAAPRPGPRRFWHQLLP